MLGCLEKLWNVDEGQEPAKKGEQVRLEKTEEELVRSAMCPMGPRRSKRWPHGYVLPCSCSPSALYLGSFCAIVQRGDGSRFLHPSAQTSALLCSVHSCPLRLLGRYTSWTATSTCATSSSRRCRRNRQPTSRRSSNRSRPSTRRDVRQERRGRWSRRRRREGALSPSLLFRSCAERELILLARLICLGSLRLATSASAVFCCCFSI